MQINWKVDPATRAVHFEVQQDIVLNPVRFSIPFAAVKVMAGGIIHAEGQQELAPKKPSLVTPT